MKISEIYYFPYPGSLHRRWRFWRCWMRNLALDVSCHPHKAKMFYFLQTGKSWCTTSVCISSDFHQPASNSTIFIMTDRLNHHICKMETHTELVSSECGLGCTLFQWTQLHCTIIATKKTLFESSNLQISSHSWGLHDKDAKFTDYQSFASF